MSCPTPYRYRRDYGGYGRGLYNSYRPGLEVIEQDIYTNSPARDISVGYSPRERRIANFEHVEPILVNDSYDDGYSRRRVGVTVVDCWQCQERGMRCTRIGIRQVAGGISGYVTQCSRWFDGRGYGGGVSTYMRGYDGESAKVDHHLDRISETAETAEMSGGLPETPEIPEVPKTFEEDDHRSENYETATEALSYVAAESTQPLQLEVCTTRDKKKIESTRLQVQSIIEKSGNNRTWVMNIEEICRTECCRYKRTGSEGVR